MLRQERGPSMTDKPKKPKKAALGSEENPRSSPGFYSKDPHEIFEQIKDDNGALAFAVTARPQYLGHEEPKVEIRRTWYKPLPESRVYWNLPPAPSTYKNEESLFERNRKFIYDYADVKDPGACDVLAAFGIATWRFEDWFAYPYVFFVGHFGAGKSTVQRVLKQICRRAVGGPSITGSALVSMMDRYNAVLVLDEAQTLNSEDKEETIAILRGAYQFGNQRIKSVPTGHGWTDKAFNAYGFVIISSHDPLEEGIMQRCLSFTMSKRTRRLKRTRKPEFLFEGLGLRSMNLNYRFLHVKDLIPEEVEEQLEQIRDDRLQELALPLLTVAPPGPRQKILSYFRALEKRKQVETESGDEADYFRALDFFTTEKGKDFIKPEGRILLSGFKQALLSIKQEAEPEYDQKWLSPRARWKVLERLGFHHGGHTREGSSVSFDRSRGDAFRPP